MKKDDLKWEKDKVDFSGINEMLGQLKYSLELITQQYKDKKKALWQLHQQNGTKPN